jgi:hypothetical protein
VENPITDTNGRATHVEKSLHDNFGEFSKIEI